MSLPPIEKPRPITPKRSSPVKLTNRRSPLEHSSPLPRASSRASPVPLHGRLSPLPQAGRPSPAPIRGRLSLINPGASSCLLLKEFLSPPNYAAIVDLFKAFQKDQKRLNALDRFAKESSKDLSGVLSLAWLSKKNIDKSYVITCIDYSVTDTHLYCVCQAFRYLAENEIKPFEKERITLNQLLCKVIKVAEKQTLAGLENQGYRALLEPLRSHVFSMSYRGHERRFLLMKIAHLAIKEHVNAAESNLPSVILQNAFSRFSSDHPRPEVLFRVDITSNKIHLEQYDSFGLKNQKELEALLEAMGPQFLASPEFDLIYVKTSISDQPGLIVDLRITRAQGQRALQIQRIERRDLPYQGTQVTLVMKHSGQSELELAAAAENLAQGTLKCPPTVLPPLKLYLETPLARKSLMAFTEIPCLILADFPFHLYQFKNSQPSEVLFEGFPALRLLREFLIEEGIVSPEIAECFSQGLGLNLPKNYDRAKLVLFIAEYYYEHCLNTKAALRHFPSITANLSFDQADPRISNEPYSLDTLLHILQKNPSPKNLKYFFHHYRPITGRHLSFVNWIDRFYLNFLPKIALIEKKYSTQSNEVTAKEIWAVLQAFTDSARKEGCHQTLLEDLVLPWIRNRLDVIVKTLPTPLQDVRFPEALIELRTKLLTIATITLTNYTTIYCNHYTIKPVAIRFTFESNTALAWYTHDSHTITINLRYNHLSSILALAKYLESGALEVDLEKEETFIGTELKRSGTAPVINHELEHARRSHLGIEDCQHGDHLSIDAHIVPFDECAISYAKAVWKSGLYQKWKHLQKNLTISEKELALLQSYERVYPNETMALFAKEPSAIQATIGELIEKIDPSYLFDILHTCRSNKTCYIVCRVLSLLDPVTLHEFKKQRAHLKFLLFSLVREAELYAHHSYESLRNRATLEPLLELFSHHFFIKPHEVNQRFRGVSGTHFFPKNLKTGLLHLPGLLVTHLLSRQNGAHAITFVVVDTGKTIELHIKDELGTRNPADLQLLLEQVGGELLSKSTVSALIVKTTLPDADVCELKILPARKNNVLVVQKIESKTASEHQETKFIIVFDESELTTRERRAKAQAMAQELMDQPPISLGSIQFYLDTPLSKERLQTRFEGTPFKIGSSEIYTLENSSAPSEVCIEGRPTFIPLEQFLIKEQFAPAAAKLFRKGCVLNLPANYRRQELRNMCFDWYYHHQISNLSARRHFPNLGTNLTFDTTDPMLSEKPSNETLLEVLERDPTPQHIQYFFHHYRSIGNPLSFIDWLRCFYNDYFPRLQAIEKQIGHLPNAEIEKQINDLYKDFCNAAKAGQSDLIEELVCPWIRNRLDLIIQSLPVALQQVDFPQALAAIKKKFMRIASYTLTNYTNIYCRYHKIPPVRIEFVHAFNAGIAQYRPDSNSIAINLSMIPLTSILKLADYLNKQYIKTLIEELDPLVAITINQNGDCGFLNHELEHARRRHFGIPDQNDHSNHFDVAGEFVSFEQCAASYAADAWNHGTLYHQWEKLHKDLKLPEEELALIHDYETRYYHETMIFFVTI